MSDVPSTQQTHPTLRLVLLATVPVTAIAFLVDQAKFFTDAGYEVIIVCSGGPEQDELLHLSTVPVRFLDMSREISPRRDLTSLIGCRRVLRELDPDIVMYSTPKAALLGALGSWTNRVPKRIYMCRGLRFESTTGARRILLMAIELVICRLSSLVLCVSPSVREALLRRRLSASATTTVLNQGSCNGIDPMKFMTALASVRARRTTQSEKIVLTFMGRLTRDKGIEEMLTAFTKVHYDHPDAELHIFGDLDLDHGLRPETVRLIESFALGSTQRDSTARGVFVHSFVKDVSMALAQTDILLLPTYREGFPTVVLEAAACEIPTITTTATGARDAVIDGDTGWLCQPRSAIALELTIRAAILDPTEIGRRGRRARERALSLFQQGIVWGAYLDHFTSKRT